MTTADPTILTFLDFELDPIEGTLRRAGQTIEVQPKVFEALVYFCARPERLVSKQELLQALWPDTVVEEASLTQVVFKTRRALGEPESPRVLHTVVKRGFRFAVTVERRPTTPSSSPSTSESQAAPLIAPTPDLPSTDTPSTPEPEAAPLIAPTPTPPPTASSSTTDKHRRLTRLLPHILLLTLVLLFTFTPTSPDLSTSPLRGDPTTRQTTRLTRLPERDQEPALAPDLTWFAFASTRGTGGPYALWVQRLDGGEPVQVTRPRLGEDTTPRVFPDGRAIAFTRCTTTNPHSPGCAVWRVAPLGGDERLLVPDCNLGDLDKTGQTLVCMRGTPRGTVAFIEAPLEKDRPPTTLHEWAGPLEALRLSPSGDLAFLSNAEPYLLPRNSASRTPARLFETPANVHTLTFDPTGHHLLIDLSKNGRRTLWAAPLTSLPVARSALHPLTLGSGVDLYPELAPNGSLLLYAHETHESALYLVDPDGRRPRRLDVRTSFLSLSLGGAGRLIALWDADSPTPADESSLLELDALLETPGPASTDSSRTSPPLSARGLGRGAFPALSPDETRVALVEHEALVILDLTSDRRQPLIPSGVREVRPAFSPDGLSIAFATRGDTPGLALTATQPTSETHPRLVARGHFSAPTFTPDGQHLLASGTPLGSETTGLHLITLTDLALHQPTLQPPAMTHPLPDPPVPRFLSPHRSYEAAPLILPTHPGLAWVLVDERTSPRLVPVPLGLDLPPTDPIPLEVMADPAYWGVFDVAAHRNRGFVYLLKRVHSDIMMVRQPPPAPSPP